MKEHLQQLKTGGRPMTKNELKIKELEQENKQLKEQLENDIDRYEDTISYQLGFDKGKEYMQQRIDKAIENCKKSVESINQKLENNKEPFEVVDGKIICLNDYQVCRLKAIRMKCKELLEILGDKENER